MKNSVSFPFPNKEDSYKLFISDPCYEKIPKEERRKVFNDAWDFGKKAARNLKKEEKDTSVVQLIENVKLKLIYKDIDYVVGNQRYFCEFIPGKKRVTVYKKGIQLWADYQNMEYEKALNIILSHEYYHYLEETVLGWTSKRCLVPMLQIGKIKLGKTGIASLSEVGANAFANEMINLEEE